MASPSAPPPFRFTLLPQATQMIGSHAALVHQRGFPGDFAREMKEILDRLQRDPIAWGDPPFNYHHLGMTYFRGLSVSLFTFYSVNEPARQVFVQKFSIHPYSRLA